MFLKIFKSMGKYFLHDVNGRVKHRHKYSKSRHLLEKSIKIEIRIDLEMGGREGQREEKEKRGRRKADYSY